jgi:hypothetical protein
VLESSGRTALVSGEQICSVLPVPRNAPVRRRGGFEIRRRRAQFRFVAIQSMKSVCLSLSH